MGIIQSNKAVQLFYADLKEKYGMEYILTYRLNQDVIENFFGIIRRKGGLHDHPDRQEFKYRLRSFLLGHNEAAISNNGNVEPDDTPDLEGTHLSLTGTILQQLDVEAPVEETGDEELNVLESDGLEHLAGYICKRLQIAGVGSSKDQTFTWVNQLSEGGFVKPPRKP